MTKQLTPYEKQLVNEMSRTMKWRQNVLGSQDPLSRVHRHPAWAYFDGTVNGIQDGQHIYNHGDKYPVFARVKNGVLYAVGVDLSATQNYCDATNNCDYVRQNPLYNQPVKLGRAWLTTTLGSYGNLFADMPHQEADFDYPASIYLERRTTTTSNWKAPQVGGSGSVPPAPTNPAPNPTPSNPTPTPSNPTPTPSNPSPSTPAPAGVTALSTNDWLLWGGIGFGVLILLILVIVMIRR